ncbi:hypothetical protein TSMEX_001894 [Taenia solium]|eukprot:TsM_001188600 transcript=TsM_001188600 gene=TsM_001188600
MNKKVNARVVKVKMKLGVERTENFAQLAKWREEWVEDKDTTNEEELSNCLCLLSQIKHGYSVFLLWFRRSVSIVRVFIILGDSLFLWVLVFATYLLTDPAIEKQHIIGIINNDTMPYPPEPEFDIQEYVSKIVAYHRPFSRAAAIISFSVCFTTLLSTIGAAVSHGYSSATVSDYIVKMLENTFDQYRSTADKKIHYLWDTIMGMVKQRLLNYDE